MLCRILDGDRSSTAASGGAGGSGAGDADDAGGPKP